MLATINRKVLVLAAISCCFALQLNVAANQDSAEDVVQKYWAAMQKQDWALAASLLHPKSLKKIRTATDNYVAALLEGDKYGMNLRFQFGASTREEYDKLSDAVIFQRVLEQEARGPGFVEVIKATTRQTVGTVKEREDLVHILYKADVRFFDSQGNRLKTVTFDNHGDMFSLSATIRVADPDEDRVAVISARKENGAWLVLLGNELETEINRWAKNIRQSMADMQKMANSLSSKKARSKPKASRTSKQPN